MKQAFEYNNEELVQLFYEDLVRKGAIASGRYNFNIRTIPNPTTNGGSSPHYLVYVQKIEV